MKITEFKMETMCIPTFNFEEIYTSIEQNLKQTINNETERILIYENLKRLTALSTQEFCCKIGMSPHDYYTNFMNGCTKNQENFEIFNERIKKINSLKEIIKKKRGY